MQWNNCFFNGFDTPKKTFSIFLVKFKNNFVAGNPLESKKCSFLNKNQSVPLVGCNYKSPSSVVNWPSHGINNFIPKCFNVSFFMFQ